MQATRPVAPRHAAGRRFALTAWWSAWSPLARDLTVILIVKAALLFLLWLVFFRAPAAPGMTMEPQRVEVHLLATTPASEPAHAIP